MTINYETLIKMEPREFANMICYLSTNCKTCPVHNKKSESLGECKNQLVSWIMSEHDKGFWGLMYVE